MFEGMYGYEVVLMVLGILLFVILAVVLAIYVWQKRGPTVILSAFFMPVVMIGFPSFQKISYENGKLELEKAVQEVARHPNDQAARAKLNASAAQIAQRPTNDPAVRISLARAYKVLGEKETARTHVDAALKVSPTLPEGLLLRKDLER